MKRLRYVAIALLFVITLLLNIERLDLGTSQNPVDIQTFVYVLASVAALLTIALPISGRVATLPWAGAWIGLYFLIKATYLPQRPLFGGISTYLTITELSLLSLTVVLAQLFSRQINEIQDALASVILSDTGKRTRSVEDSVDEIEREFVRSRRNNLLLSVLIVQPDARSMEANLQRAVLEAIESFKQRYLYNSLLQAISKEMRRTDLVLEQPKHDRFILLLPDTGAEAASQLKERIQATAEQKLGIRVVSGSASFPEHALTLEEMLQIAEAEMAGSPDNRNGYHTDEDGNKALAEEALNFVKGTDNDNH